MSTLVLDHGSYLPLHNTGAVRLSPSAASFLGTLKTVDSIQKDAMSVY